MELKVTLSEAQYKALTCVFADPQDWYTGLVLGRADSAAEEIFNAEVQRKISNGETISGTKEQIVLNSEVETVLEREARLAEELAAQQAAE